MSLKVIYVEISRFISVLGPKTSSTNLFHKQEVLLTPWKIDYFRHISKSVMICIVN